MYCISENSHRFVSHTVLGEYAQYHSTVYMYSTQQGGRIQQIRMVKNQFEELCT
jgi:hypothetical protein